MPRAVICESPPSWTSVLFLQTLPVEEEMCDPEEDLCKVRLLNLSATGSSADYSSDTGTSSTLVLLWHIGCGAATIQSQQPQPAVPLLGVQLVFFGARISELITSR